MTKKKQTAVAAAEVAVDVIADAVETVAAEVAATPKVRVRNLLREKLAGHIAAGDFGHEGQHSTAVRKACLQYVIDCGGAKNSGPAEYNTVMLELISANVVRKVARGVYVAVAAAETAAAE